MIMDKIIAVTPLRTLQIKAARTFSTCVHGIRCSPKSLVKFFLSRSAFGVDVPDANLVYEAPMVFGSGPV